MFDLDQRKAQRASSASHGQLNPKLAASLQMLNSQISAKGK
jgi:hypothetical protein